MTEDQKLLAKYLVDLNTPLAFILFIVGSLWRDELVMEMFQYIAEHPDAEYPELYSVACKIAAREGTLNGEDLNDEMLDEEMLDEEMLDY